MPTQFCEQLFHSTEFWSALIGALVGGAIALFAQLIALWEQRKTVAQKIANDFSRVWPPHYS